jgi:hypothetical protein
MTFFCFKLNLPTSPGGCDIGLAWENVWLELELQEQQAQGTSS